MSARLNTEQERQALYTLLKDASYIIKQLAPRSAALTWQNMFNQFMQNSCDHEFVLPPENKELTLPHTLYCTKRCGGTRLLQHIANNTLVIR